MRFTIFRGIMYNITIMKRLKSSFTNYAVLRSLIGVVAAIVMMSNVFAVVDNDYYYNINEVYYGDYYSFSLGFSLYEEIRDPKYPETYWFRDITFHEPLANTLPANLQCVSATSNQITDYNLEGYISIIQPLGNDIVIAYNQECHEESCGNVIDDSIEYTEEYFRIDDWADNSSDTSHICRLSLSTDYTNGFLQSETMWYPSGQYNNPQSKTMTIPADIDVFKIDLDPGIYCIETEIVNLSFGLEISVYNSYLFNSDSRIGYFNDDYNRYDGNGIIDGSGQRLYFTNDMIRTCYIELKQRFGMQGFADTEYKIRVLKARPVILVHGINASPKDSSDTATAFEHMRDYLGYFKEVMPCVCYDFPWWSNDEDSNGFEKYVGIDKNDDESLYKFAYEKFKLHGDYKANIILHSMGGFVVRYQLDYQNFADMINQVLFIDSPMYGSDLANFLVARTSANNVFNTISSSLDTSQANNIHLSRGSDTVWKMHHEKDLNIPASRIAFTVGTSRGPYDWLWLAMFGYDYGEGLIKDAIRANNFPAYKNTIKALFKDRYLIGLKRSDGIVPVTSQNLLNLVPDIPEANYIFLEKHHTEVQKLDLNNMNSCNELYNLIKARMNAQ